MKCHIEKNYSTKDEKELLKVLLMGNPNVGKSVIFSKLTGMDVISSNYTGTTVSYTKGQINHRGKKSILIDVPGVYSLESTSPAEEVAVKMLKEESADAVICVLDATNLERNLFLALQLKQENIPVVFALNLADVAKQQGIIIDTQSLEKELGAPVISTVAVKNKGLNEVLLETWRAIKRGKEQTEKISKSTETLWKEAEDVAKKVQIFEEHKPTILERLGDATLKPFPGIPIAAVVLILTLSLVVGVGKAVRGLIFIPLINNYVAPFFTYLVSFFITEGPLFNVLVGEYGVLIKGIEWPFALILPYVFLFYVALSFLEDSGYLPRLGVLVDGAMRKVGLQGGSIISLIMGYGCAVPAILGTRAATSKKERVIVAAIVSLGIPCVAQTGAFISLLGDRSIFVLITVYLISFVAMFIAGTILNRTVSGKTDLILLEIPNLLMPDFKSYMKKIYLRTKHFMVEAELPMLLAIAFAAIVAELELLNTFGRYIEPLVAGWLGLPKEATIGLILGILRRELAVLPLLELNLSTLQLLVGSVVALFYLPCLSVLAVLIKEFNLKIALTIATSTIIIAILVGGIINQIGSFLQVIF